MRLPVFIATLAIAAAPACAPYPPLAGPAGARADGGVGVAGAGVVGAGVGRPAEVASRAGADEARRAGREVAHVVVTARIVVVDRDAVTRAGLDYLVLGSDRVRVSASRRGDSRGARIAAGTHGVTAFLDAARASRWVASESTQQVLTLSGGEGVVSSTELAAGRYASRTRGPSLVVSPTVLADGSVHLRVSARHEDSVTYAWGYGVDGSPAAVDTELIAPSGQEILLASSTTTRSTRDAGLLHWGAADQGRDVLVSVTAEVLYR